MKLEINQVIQDFQVVEQATAEDSEMGLSLLSVLAAMYPEGMEGIAVALHDQVIARADWAGTFLNENDKLLLFTATQGG